MLSDPHRKRSYVHPMRPRVQYVGTVVAAALAAPNGPGMRKPMSDCKECGQAAEARRILREAQAGGICQKPPAIRADIKQPEETSRS